MMFLVLSLVPASLPAAQMSAQVPAALDAPNVALVALFHAEGAQIYQCSLDANQKLTWKQREPIATLLSERTTVGRHYAGPTWEHADGSAVTAKVVSITPGATPDDIPSLRLEVTAQRGEGRLTGTNIVQRLNTKGGVAAGPCEKAGSYRSVPYSADYVFLRKE
jgi:uncharacterized protein DUF3455